MGCVYCHQGDEDNRSAGVVNDELLHGVRVGHARQGRHGFGHFRTSLPFRSADS